MKKSRHYLKRASQRGITPETELLIDVLGKESRAVLNRTLRYISKKDRNAISMDLRRILKIIERNGNAVIIEGMDTLITTYKRSG
jgi:hypothetical protein